MSGLFICCSHRSGLSRLAAGRPGGGRGTRVDDEPDEPSSGLPPDTIPSAETGRPLRRGVKMLTIDAGGVPFTYGRPGWWASLDDPADEDGQLVDEDNVVRAAARREARAKARHAGGHAVTGGPRC